MKKSIFLLTFLIIVGVSFLSCKKWSETGTGNLRIVANPKGQTLGYDTASGVKLITNKGLAFKDLNKNDKLDIYEDWRLPADERAKDLASKLNTVQIAGLVLHSGTFANDPDNSTNLTDAIVKALTDDNLRNIHVSAFETPEIAAIWNNNVQSLCESIGFGIPANKSSDPRNGTTAAAEFNDGASGKISMWPGTLGLAASFDPSVALQFGQVVSNEYRALGITTALSPQIDLGTDPRWSRINSTFGESPQLSADMARAYIDGFQTSIGDKVIEGGWGYSSVNAMAKHWPSGGTEEGGRDAHYFYGKYAVYPRNNFSEQIIPFIEGALKLDGETGIVSAIMPYYTISYNIDTKNGENVGNNFNSYIITDMLRGTYGFDGVICTDWNVTKTLESITTSGATPWGVEKLTTAERSYKAIKAGVDQIGGTIDVGPILEAYNMGVKEYGEEFIRERFEQSAIRTLINIFRVGLFENPYLNVDETKIIVGNPDFMKAGYEAQLKSIVLLKNKNKVLPVQKNKTVYIPKKFTPTGIDRSGNTTPASTTHPVNLDIVKKYFNVTENPAEADFALIIITSPNSGTGFNADDIKKGGNGYLPISLQYKPYKAIYSRDPSIAGGDPFESFTNRTYKGKSITTSNASDLQMILDTRRVMKNKPVIVSINMSKPMVFSEFEKEADAIIATFGVQDQAIMDILSGGAEPSGLLPLQMPIDMKTVEEQFEDVPYDMVCHTDSEGNTYDFGFGLNWSGIINDARVEKYKKAEK